MSELFLIVRIAGERVALRAAQVEAVVEIEEVSPVPCTAPHVAGLSALRSRVVTVIDCHVSIGAAADAAPHRDAAVAVVDGHPYALLVDGVEDVLEANGDPRPLPGSLAHGWSRIASASVEIDGDLLLLLDIPALIAGPLAEAA